MKIIKMKTITRTLAILTLAFLVSCIDEENVSIDPQNDQNNESTVFKLDFEDFDENLKTHYFGGVTKDREVYELVQASNRCGSLFLGKTEDFTEWKGYDFKGNDTRFLGLDMGGCEDFFEGVVKTKFTLKEKLSKDRASMKFKYYMPSDFTGWGNNIYEVNVYVERGDIVYGDNGVVTFFNGNQEVEKEVSGIEYVVKFKAEINQNGWVDFSESLSEDLPAGDYNLVVQIIGSSAAIDDIRIVEEE